MEENFSAVLELDISADWHISANLIFLTFYHLIVWWFCSPVTLHYDSFICMCTCMFLLHQHIILESHYISGRMISLSLCIRARDQRMNAVVTDLSLFFPCLVKSSHTSCWSIYRLFYDDPTSATVRVYCWLLHYRCYPGFAITIRTSLTIQPSIICCICWY